METMEQLYNGFFLSSVCENAKISGCKKMLRVAPIKKSDKYEKLEIDYSYFAFAEKNQNGEMEYFHGLKNFLLIEKSDFPPIFIFDNHNHAITFRYYVVYTKKIQNAQLIHIDQHSDCWENKNHLELGWESNELENVFEFCNEKCNVWNFIWPTIESGIISSQVQIRSSMALKTLKINKDSNFFLDIDLDFCLDWIGRNKINMEKLKLLKNVFDEIWSFAKWITIATSPYFLDQQLAIDMVETLIF